MTMYSFRLALADIIAITRRTFVNFGNHECAQRSAALAYYALFSMFPLLLLAISSVGFMLETGVPLAVDAQTLVLQAVEQTFPQATELVEQIIVTTRRTRGGTGLIGLIVLAWSASNIFTHLRLALNVIWNTGLPQSLGGVMRLRLKALGMALSTALLLLLVTISDAVLEIIARYVTRLPWSDTIWLLGRPLLMTGLTVVLFAFIYRFLPRAPLRLADVWPGAIVAAMGWELLKRGFVWYTTSATDWSQLYGPIAGVIGLLLWLYLSAQILLFGAEFSATYSQLLAEKHAATLPPDPVGTASEPAEPSPGELEAPPTPSDVPSSPQIQHPGLARGTAVGLVGAGVAGTLALVGVLATGWRLLTRYTSTETSKDTSLT